MTEKEPDNEIHWLFRAIGREWVIALLWLFCSRRGWKADLIFIAGCFVSVYLGWRIGIFNNFSNAMLCWFGRLVCVS